LVRANQALYDYCRAYDLPCISGKDSMKTTIGSAMPRFRSRRPSCSPCSASSRMSPPW
jgi:phosphoribosylformylglycinamidine (FGAM) synthase-like enzyme